MSVSFQTTETTDLQTQYVTFKRTITKITKITQVTTANSALSPAVNNNEVSTLGADINDAAYIYLIEKLH